MVHDRGEVVVVPDGRYLAPMFDVIQDWLDLRTSSVLGDDSRGYIADLVDVFNQFLEIPIALHPDTLLRFIESRPSSSTPPVSDEPELVAIVFWLAEITMLLPRVKGISRFLLSDVIRLLIRLESFLPQSIVTLDFGRTLSPPSPFHPPDPCRRFVGLVGVFTRDNIDWSEFAGVVADLEMASYAEAVTTIALVLYEDWSILHLLSSLPAHGNEFLFALVQKTIWCHDIAEMFGGSFCGHAFTAAERSLKLLLIDLLSIQRLHELQYCLHRAQAAMATMSRSSNSFKILLRIRNRSTLLIAGLEWDEFLEILEMSSGADLDGYLRTAMTRWMCMLSSSQCSGPPILSDIWFRELITLIKVILFLLPRCNQHYLCRIPLMYRAFVRIFWEWLDDLHQAGFFYNWSGEEVGGDPSFPSIPRASGEQLADRIFQMLDSLFIEMAHASQNLEHDPLSAKVMFVITIWAAELLLSMEEIMSNSTLKDRLKMLRWVFAQPIIQQLSPDDFQNYIGQFLSLFPTYCTEKDPDYVRGGSVPVQFLMMITPMEERPTNQFVSRVLAATMTTHNMEEVMQYCPYSFLIPILYTTNRCITEQGIVQAVVSPAPPTPLVWGLLVELYDSCLRRSRIIDRFLLSESGIQPDPEMNEDLLPIIYDWLVRSSVLLRQCHIGIARIMFMLALRLAMRHIPDTFFHSDSSDLSRLLMALMTHPVVVLLVEDNDFDRSMSVFLGRFPDRLVDDDDAPENTVAVRYMEMVQSRPDPALSLQDRGILQKTITMSNLAIILSMCDAIQTIPILSIVFSSPALSEVHGSIHDVPDTEIDLDLNDGRMTVQVRALASGQGIRFDAVQRPEELSMDDLDMLRTATAMEQMSAGHPVMHRSNPSDINRPCCVCYSPLAHPSVLRWSRGSRKWAVVYDIPHLIHMAGGEVRHELHHICAAQCPGLRCPLCRYQPDTCYGW